MQRRGHKKSRLGCTDCKKRHVKCDETRPSCVNCKTANLTCSYVKDDAPSTQPKATSWFETGSPVSIETPDFNRLPIQAIPFRSPGDTSVNFDHLELLHNFQSVTYKSFVTAEDVARNYMAVATREGFRHRFLMYEVLALSAIHLSLHRPERAEFYRQQSSDLQALAVQGFNEIMMDINDDNYLAVFIFSSMMGLHAFCETFTSLQYRADFNVLLDHFTESMRLIRGITVVMSGFWEALAQSEIKTMLSEGSYMAIDPSRDQTCKPLREMLKVADLSPRSTEIYDKTITELERAFEAERLSETSSRAISTIFAWVVIADESYTTLLQQRRPEALVVLAFYAVLLHRKRDAWAVQDAGKYLILAIKRYLGSHWAQWLSWPMSVICEDGTPKTPTPSTPSSQSPAAFH